MPARRNFLFILWFRINNMNVMKRWRNYLWNRIQQIAARRSVQSWIHVPSFTHNCPDKITACFTASLISPPLDALCWVKIWTIWFYLASKTILPHCSYHLKCFTGQRSLLVRLLSISTFIFLCTIIFLVSDIFNSFNFINVTDNLIQ